MSSITWLQRLALLRLRPIGAWNIWIDWRTPKHRSKLKHNKKSVSDAPRAEQVVPNYRYSFTWKSVAEEEKNSNGSGWESFFLLQTKKINYSQGRRQDRLSGRFKMIQNARHTHIPKRNCKRIMVSRRHKKQMTLYCHRSYQTWNWKRRMIYASSNGSVRRTSRKIGCRGRGHTFFHRIFCALTKFKLGSCERNERTERE